MILDLLPWLTAMAVLMAASAFFSASEAALFSLRWPDRRAMADGSSSQRIAVDLLGDPDRLLSAVLFWNLTINLAYFALASVTALRLEEKLEHSQTAAFAFGFAALLAIIFGGEMLPKSLGVLKARSISGLVAIPLAVAVRLADPLMPALRGVTVLSRRLIWPGFKREPYLEVSDLERAIALSTEDSHLLEQEQTALQNIVLMSEFRVDELMRPRTQFLTFRPPVSLHDLEGKPPPSGYLLVTEPDSEEVVGAVRLDELFDVPLERLEHYAEPVVIVPWGATVAAAFEKLHERDLEVAAVVNEYGETIGVLTLRDILDSIFTASPQETAGALARRTLEPIDGSRWRVTGMTTLRRLQRHFQVETPPTRNVTVAGVVQETLQKIAEAGDECDWGPFHFIVLKTPQRGRMLLELRVSKDEDKS